MTKTRTTVADRAYRNGHTIEQQGCTDAIQTIFEAIAHLDESGVTIEQYALTRVIERLRSAEVEYATEGTQPVSPEVLAESDLGEDPRTDAQRLAGDVLEHSGAARKVALEKRRARKVLRAAANSAGAGCHGLRNLLMIALDASTDSEFTDEAHRVELAVEVLGVLEDALTCPPRASVSRLKFGLSQAMDD